MLTPRFATRSPDHEGVAVAADRGDTICCGAVGDGELAVAAIGCNAPRTAAGAGERQGDWRRQFVLQPGLHLWNACEHPADRGAETGVVRGRHITRNRAARLQQVDA